MLYRTRTQCIFQGQLNAHLHAETQHVINFHSQHKGAQNGLYEITFKEMGTTYFEHVKLIIKTKMLC